MSPGSSTPAPVPPVRAPTRFSWLGIALLGGAALVAALWLIGVLTQARQEAATPAPWAAKR